MGYFWQSEPAIERCSKSDKDLFICLAQIWRICKIEAKGEAWLCGWLNLRYRHGYSFEACVCGLKHSGNIKEIDLELDKELINNVLEKNYKTKESIRESIKEKNFGLLSVTSGKMDIIWIQFWWVLTVIYWITAMSYNSRATCQLWNHIIEIVCW